MEKVEIKIMKRRGMFPVSMDWIPFCEGGSFCYPKFEECFFLDADSDPAQKGECMMKRELMMINKFVEKEMT